MDWQFLRSYSQRVLGQSPKRLEQAVNILVKLKLARYEILGEVPAENARAFDVRVTYIGADEPEILRFVAIGVDPMWIFRREDYEEIWQHDAEATADRVGEPAKKP